VVKEKADMTISTFSNAQDPYLRIARQRFGIDVEAAATSGDPAEIKRVQTLLDALAEAYEIGFEDGEHYVTSNDVPLDECVTTLDTAPASAPIPLSPSHHHFPNSTDERCCWNTEAVCRLSPPGKRRVRAWLHSRTARSWTHTHPHQQLA
jgi:hypothetical protein